MIRHVLFLMFLFYPFAEMRTASPPTVSEQLRARLRTTIPNYNLRAKNFIDALTRVAGEFQIPMGIAWINTPGARHDLSLSWTNATLQDIIEAVTKTQPGFQVQVGDGIVHIRNPKVIPPEQDFLTLRVNRFEVNNEHVDFVSRKLHDLVKLTLSPPKPQSGPGGIGGSPGYNLDEAKISMEMHNVTVEEILDRMALSSTKRIWIVTFSDDPTVTATGIRRTLTLWNTFPIPDEAQPLWDMFHWGDAIPTAVLAPKPAR